MYGETRTCCCPPSKTFGHCRSRGSATKARIDRLCRFARGVGTRGARAHPATRTETKKAGKIHAGYPDGWERNGVERTGTGRIESKRETK